MRKELIKLLLLSTLIFFSTFSFAVDRIIKTPYFVIFYPSWRKGSAEDLLKSLEYYRTYVEKLTGNRRKSVPVVIEDAGMLTNGYANPGFDRIVIFSYPPQLGELQYTENWYTGVGIHEYTHLLHMQNSSRFPGLLTSFFGYSFSPNLFSPSWLTEGIAVYNESNYSRYSGRLNDTYYRNYGLAGASEGTFPDITEATYYPSRYPSGTSYYLFGSLFFDYLAETYGEESFSEFFNAYGGSILSYASPLFPFIGMDRTARKVFGRTWPALWDDFRDSYNRIKKEEGQYIKRLTNHGWNIRNLTQNEGKLYYERSFQVKTAPFSNYHFNCMVEFNPLTDESTNIMQTTSSYQHPLKFSYDKIYFLEYEFKSGFRNITNLGFGITRLLFEYDRSADRKRLVIKDEIRAFDILKNGDILFSRDKDTEFGSEIYLVSGTTFQKSLLCRTDMLIERIISDTERIVVTARRDFENFGLYLFDPGEKAFSEIINLASLQKDAYLISDKLIFSSNHEYSQACYLYDFKKDMFFRLKNSSYAIYPILLNEKLYFVSLNSAGNDIYLADAEFEPCILKEPKKENNASCRDIEYQYGSYLDNLKTIYPKLRIPYFLFDQDKKAGLYIQGNDALGHFEYTADICYDLDNHSFDSYFLLGTCLLSPLYLRAGYEEEDNGTYSLLIQYPLLYRLRGGLSRLSAGIYWESYNNNRRKEICPYLYLGIHYPFGSISSYHSYIIESRSIDSAFSRNGMINQLYFRHYIKKSQVSLYFLSVYDKKFNGYYDYSMRGYSDKLKSNDFSAFKFDFSVPVIKIREGLWNPNVFIEDVFFDLFLDYMYTKENDYFSAGAEIHFETRALFSFPFDIYIRASLNKDDETLIGFGIVSNDFTGIFQKFYKRICDE